MKKALGIAVYSILGLLVILYLGYTTAYHAWRTALPNVDVNHAHHLGMIFYWLTVGSLVAYIAGLVLLIRKAGKKKGKQYIEVRWTIKDPIGFNGGLNLYAYVANDLVNFIDPLGLAIGDFPTAPPGYNPNTWTTGQWDNGRWFVTDPNGDYWTTHPEDKGHWRHWDKQDPTTGKQEQVPPNAGKPRPNQKKPSAGQCPADPSGDAPFWEPTANSDGTWPGIPGLPALPSSTPIPALPGIPPIRIPVRTPIPILGFP